MSAIAGSVSLRGQTSPSDEVDGILAVLAFRGPDGESKWTGEGVVLGHRLLATAPGCGRSPFRDPRVGLVVTADSRLDQRDRLSNTLGLPPADSDTPDEAYLLAAYLRWGPAAVDHLRGDFAAAIWDESRRVLVCMRDPAGIKPFYYHHGADRFAFASQAKGLLGIPGVGADPDEIRLADFLIPFLDNHDLERTSWRDVKRLPPGGVLTLGPTGGVELLPRRWPVRRERMPRRSDEEYAEGFREVFLRAVESRQQGPGKVGVLLSGGLDSSSIFGCARDVRRRAGGGDIPTFSATFREIKACDERSHLEAVLSGGGADPHYVDAESLDPMRDLDRYVRIQDGLFDNGHIYVTDRLYQEASAQGVRVILDGHDGDNVVGYGYEALTEYALRGRWVKLAKEMHALTRLSSESPVPLTRDLVLRPLSPSIALWGWRALRRLGRPADYDYSVLRSDFVRRHGIRERLDAGVKSLAKPLRDVQDNQLAVVSGGGLLEIIEMYDRLGAHHCIEPRYPFMDRDVVDYCLSLPPDQQLHRGWSRVVQRRAMAGILPDSVRNRWGKADWSSMWEWSYRKYCPGAIEDIIYGNRNLLEEYVDFNRIQSTLGRYESTGSSRDLDILWRVALIAVWLRQGHPSPLVGAG